MIKNLQHSPESGDNIASTITPGLEHFKVKMKQCQQGKDHKDDKTTVEKIF
jgi:hypothetical protein